MKKITLLLSAMLMAVMSFAGVVTFDADTDQGNAIVYTEGASGQEFTITKEGLTITVSSGLLGTYNNEHHYRIYKNQTLKITSTAGAITSVQFTCTANGDTKYGPGCFTASTGEYGHDGGAVGTWTGSATEITFSASTNQVRASQIVVAIDGAEIPGGDNNGGDDNGGTTPPPANPEGVITCAEAVAICEATGSTATTETYTIRGYVTEIKYAYSEQYGTATFWIADTKDGGSVLQAYSCAPLTDADKVFAVGAYVELVGKLKQYNTTNEVEKGTYTVITPADGGTTPPTPPVGDLVGDGTADNPYTVEDVIALNNTSKGPHYVKGFIVGQVNGASIKGGLDTEAPFVGSTNSDGTVATQGTNLMIASVAGDTINMVAVQLPKGGLRDEFNLVDHPEMLGVEVLICGSLEKYFGVPGIKSPTSIEVIGAEDPNVVNVEGMQYADAYYYTEDEIGYFDFDMYVDVDPDTYEYTYPELYVAVKANSKTALNGTYDLLYAGLWTSANDSIEMGEALGTVTIKNVDTEGNYSFKGSFVGADGKTYKFNDEMYVWGFDVDTEEEIVFSEESTTPPTPPTPPTNGAIVFDADVDKGNAGTNSDNAAAYQITKNGVTLDVTSGILGTYNNEMHYRIYKNQTLTVTSTVGNIAKIEFTCTANGDEKYGPGCFTASTGEYGHDGAAVGTWTGDAATITFTASANQVRATQIVVTLVSATAVEDVTVGATPVKVIENGQVLIIRGEHIYNVLGAQVK